MANIQVFVEGNYFFLNNGSDIDVQDYKSSVFIDPLGGGQYKISSDRFGSFIVDVDAVSPNYPSNGIAVDSLNSAYTSVTWKTFYTENTGFNPATGGSVAGVFAYVTDKTDLPSALEGVISLDDSATYLFTKTVDLTGDRLVCGENTTILGFSSENCRIKSTGLTGVALIASIYSLPMRNITIEADIALNLDGDGTTTALDWFGVNFTNCATIGTIKDYSNVVITDSAFLSSGNLTFDGSIGTIGFGSCLFDTASGQTAITLASSCVISRRFRIIYSSFVIGSGETSLNVSTSATIPVDGYILDTVNFSGGGTYNTGVQFSDNKASFIKCKGISNSRTITHYFMNTNATATVVSVIATPYKILGTTTSGSVNQRFTHSNNRATYTGALSQTFDITSVITATSGNNQLLGFYIAKNGIVITDSESRVTTSGSGRSENVKCQTFVELATGDYVEIVAKNYTATTNIVATDLSVMIRPTL